MSNMLVTFKHMNLELFSCTNQSICIFTVQNFQKKRENFKNSKFINHETKPEKKLKIS